MTAIGNGRAQFRIHERFDEDGAVRLVLVGELDLAVADQVSSRLRELKRGGYHVRIDLAQLEFIDSTGLRELIVAVSDSRRNGWRLEIETDMTNTVRRVVELVGVGSLFWPEAG
jgi:anti-anti-sigma factor